jgi:hypothetical protein
LVLATLFLGSFAATRAYGDGAVAASAEIAPAPPASEQELVSRLRTHAVSSDDFARSVFYTWTSPDQVAALRSSHALLVATSQSSLHPSPYLRLLAELRRSGQPGHELAQLLLEHSQLQGRRYAWISPFATVLGLGERTYGEALIEVVLRPEAIIGRLARAPKGDSPFRFVDLSGNPIPESQVMAHPERLAAIYHLRPQNPQEPTDFVPFREYILCNEAMVLSWSVGTEAIRARLAAETALLRALRPYFAALPQREVYRSAFPAWSLVTADAPLLVQWRAALAFDNRKYRPLTDNLDHIIAGLSRYDATPPQMIQNVAR